MAGMSWLSLLLMTSKQRKVRAAEDEKLFIWEDEKQKWTCTRETRPVLDSFQNWRTRPFCFNARFKENYRGLATLLEGAGLAFDIPKCLKFQKLIMVVVNIKTQS